MTMRRLVGAVMTLIGTAAFTACLWSVATGMRNVIRLDGGSCGTGGPYVIAHQCSGGDIRLLMVGIFGGLLSAALYAGGTSALGRPASAAGLAAWCAMFGVLGWNFINQYLHPVAGQSGSIGFLIPGVLFELMAAGGLIPLIGGIKDDLRRGNRPDNPWARVSGPPIVRAAVPSGFSSGPAGPAGPQFGYGSWSPPSMNGSLSDAVPQPKMTLPLVSLGLWLATSAVGAVIGVMLSSSLVNLLK
ncbi:MAG TPA: hypothetical protein VFI65_33335 [Streptosporangiaceae bacterium]|nr:hypothetical protein [Streptosporangiaceae bacterium]